MGPTTAEGEGAEIAPALKSFSRKSSSSGSRAWAGTVPRSPTS